MAVTAVKSPYLRWLATALAGSETSCLDGAPGGENIVLGYATGYDVADVAIFVRSLRSHYKGPVALVVDNNPELRAFLFAHDIEAVDAPKVCGKGWLPNAVVSRFAGFDALLRERPWVRHAFLTDVRDVVFQGDPFVEPLERLEFFAECEKPLASHAFNMKYLRAVAGDCLAQVVADKACICVGTVLGQREDLMRFCRLILSLGAIPRSEIGGAFGADQATCNLAVHLGLLESTVKPNHSRVATLGLVERSQLKLDGVRIVNPDGTASPVVHQYDRHADLAKTMWETWAPNYQPKVRRAPRDFRSRIMRMYQSIRRRTVELR